MLTSPQLQMLSAGLGFIQSYNNAKISKEQGKTDEFMANLSADQLIRNANRRMNQGVQQAAEDRRQGATLESDAIAQMAASGATVDPVMLARIKAKADHNSMTSIYEASTAASDLRQQAAMTRIQGKADRDAADFKSKDIMLGAFSTALSKWPRSASQNATRPDPHRYAGYSAGR